MKAQAGEQVVIRYQRDGQDRTETVGPACDSKTGGHWYCATHKKHLQNNWEADEHAGPKCKQVWFCYEHGAEQP